MKSTPKILFSALCLWALVSACISEASVTIKGKNLDDIDDIVSLTTDGGKAEMKKYSLGILSLETASVYSQWFGSDINKFYTCQISTDRSAMTNTLSELVPYDNVYNTMWSGMHTAASSSRNKNGRAVFFSRYFVDTDNGKMIVRPSAAFIGGDGKASTAKDIEITVEHDNDGGAFDQDVEGGIFLPNDDNEYFAVAILKNSNVSATGDLTCAANIFIAGMNFSGDKDVNVFDTGVVIERDLKHGYSPVSVAVGDFVGSGTTDQIAFATASSAGITMTVCKIEKDSSGNYSYREIVTENCCTYTGPMKDGYVGGRPDFYPAADTVAGDFDGDGNTEIAVVFKDDKPHSDDPDKLVFGQLNITIFKWDSDSGSFSKGANSIAVNYYNVYSYNYFATYRVNLLGLKAARADWNGEGKDGIAVLFFGHYSSEYEYDHGHYDYEQVCPYFMYWYCDEYTINPKQATFDTNNNQYFDGWGIRYGPLNDHGTPSQCIFGDKTENEEGTFYYFNQDGTKHGVPLAGYFPYVDRTFSLASGPFTGQLGTLKMIDDLAVSWSGVDGHDPRADYGHAYIFKVNHNPATATGQFIGVSTGKEVLSVYNSASTYRLALVGADFLGEGVELEEPVHLRVEGDRTYAAILQTPPYHVDNIPVPWEDDPTTPALTNFTYTEDLVSRYQHEGSSETEQDVNFDMKGSAETIESLGTGEVSSTYVKIASFALEKAGAKDAGAVLGMLTDKVETTKSEANQSSIKMELTDEFETSTSDRVLYYSSNVHVWRYPIKAPAPAWLFANLIEGDPTSASGDKFLTFSMADDPVSHATAGLEDECYQPLHEEGNLFSYPTNIAQIPGYQNRQLTLTDQSSITYSPGSYSRTISITQEAASSTTEARKVSYGAISEILGDVQVLAGNATENSMTGDRGNSSTFTKSYSTKDTLTASFPNPETKGDDYANVTFTTDLQAYADEAGILTLGFAVNNFGSTASLWQKSIYNEKPDPALYLPYRYYFNGNDVFAREDDLVATKMRGVRFYVPDAYKYTAPMLYAGRSYRIEIPIYNASFVAPDSPVEVALSFRTKDSDDKTFIGRQTVTIGGWETGKESNKAVVVFEWTVPEDMEGAKELVAEIDPDNVIDEVHEGWDPEVPGGNNFGYFLFSVVKAVSLPFRNGINNSEITLTIDGMSMGEFITYAAEQTKPFDAECVITNKGSTPIHAVLELDMIGANGEQAGSFTHNIGIMQISEKHSYKFLAVPENWRGCAELEAVVHTDSGVIRLRDAASEPSVPSGEEPRTGTVGSNGGSCDTGLSVFGLGIMLSALIIRSKAR